VARARGKGRIKAARIAGKRDFCNVTSSRGFGILLEGVSTGE
jgi:hypothetical protein